MGFILHSCGEKENLQRFNDFSGLIKCIDDLDPISPFQRIRGYRGCGTLWNNKLNSKVIPVQDGGKRLATILPFEASIYQYIVNL
jgi:hypothetical protein